MQKPSRFITFIIREEIHLPIWLALITKVFRIKIKTYVHILKAKKYEIKSKDKLCR